jgi:hypothetical protein
LGEATEISELRRSEGGGSPRLEWTAKQKLGREERREVHVECRAGVCHAVREVRGRIRGIDVRDVGTTRVPIRETLYWDIGIVRAVGETRIVRVQGREF